MNSEKKAEKMKVKKLKVVETGTFVAADMAPRKKRPVKRILVLSALLLTANVALSFQIADFSERVIAKAGELKEKILTPLTRVEVRTELLSTEDLPLSELTKLAAAKYGVPQVVLDAVINAESSGGDFLYRFEPEKFKQLRATAKGSDDEVRMLASSHGVGHVMGFNAKPRCGVHWSKLYDTRTGLDCAAKILRENLDRHRDEDDKARRIWLALRDYNGSGKAAENYATKVMAAVVS